MKKLATLLLPLLLGICALHLLLLIGGKSTTSVYQKLKDGEILQLHFSQSVGGARYLSATADEINWYSVEPDWFIIDYKYDPGTYYINNDYILTWGIEK